MPNDQAAMIAEVNRDLEKAGSAHRVETMGNPSLKDGVVMLRRLRRDFGAEAVEKLVSHNEMVHLLRVDMIEIANSAANAALDEAIKIIGGYAVIGSPQMLVARIAALKSTPSPEAQ